MTIEAAMEKIAALKRAESDAPPTSLDDTSNTSNENLEGFTENGLDPVLSPAGGSQPDPPTPVDESSKKDENLGNLPPGGNKSKICWYYVRKTCKYGAKGEGCSFNHQKKCARFMTHGDKNAKGCKKGKSCTYFHPPICWESLREGVCGRENCKFHHLRRTKKRELPVFERRPSAQAKTRAQAEHTNTQSTRRTYANTLYPRSSTVEWSEEAREEHPQDCQRNFLELKELIRGMHSQMQGLLWDPRVMANPVGDYRRLNANH